jgi:Zn-dependent peptidase ImmA (M78 family)
MNMRVEVKPEVLRWARDRSGLDDETIYRRFPSLEKWQKRDLQPTLKQLESFAEATHTPIGYLFLQAPPVEKIPIPDFRTVGNKRIGKPSPDLLETIYICQQRQEWYRDFSVSNKEDPLPFVGSVTARNDVGTTALAIRKLLDFSVEERRQIPTWAEALRQFIEQVDRTGVLVMINGVVGNNNYRKLDPSEFRGFALSDPLAPLIFINGSDTKSAQMFTLAHELAHIWLGQSALSDLALVSTTDNAVELWCNEVAAEILVPIEEFRKEIRDNEPVQEALGRLARYFKVSTLVILRRMFDEKQLSQDEFWQSYHEELNRLMAMPKSSGGDFYLTQGARVGKRFARALIANTLEGQTLHRDAFRLLGFSKLSTFRELGHTLGVI